MICKKCCKAKHGKCANLKKRRRDQRGTWCDCQHRMPTLQQAMNRLLSLPAMSITRNANGSVTWPQNTTDSATILKPNKAIIVRFL